MKIKKKKKIKTFSWRSRLDPCSTRIFTICSRPLSAAMWRAVFPSFNKKKKLFKKKNKNKIKYHTTQPLTINQHMKQPQTMNPQSINKEMRKNKEIKMKIKIKKKMKTSVWRWTLDPCSIRIFTICSKPFQVA